MTLANLTETEPPKPAFKPGWYRTKPGPSGATLVREFRYIDTAESWANWPDGWERVEITTADD